MSIKGVAVDDEAMVRVGLRMVLSAEPDIEVVGYMNPPGRLAVLERQLPTSC